MQDLRKGGVSESRRIGQGTLGFWKQQHSYAVKQNCRGLSSYTPRFASTHLLVPAFYLPSQDRAAKYLVQGLERDGKLQPGGTIVEGTAGNTGIGLTYVAAAKGYKSIIVIPRTQTQEKKDTLRQAGATLIEVDAKPYRHPNNYIKLSGRLANEIPGGAWANQVS